MKAAERGLGSTVDPRHAWIRYPGLPASDRLYPMPNPGIALMLSGSNPASSAK